MSESVMKYLRDYKEKLLEDGKANKGMFANMTDFMDFAYDRGFDFDSNPNAVGIAREYIFNLEKNLTRELAKIRIEKAFEKDNSIATKISNIPPTVAFGSGMVTLKPEIKTTEEEVDEILKDF